MKYIVYLTKNLKSKVGELNKIYIGVHQTNDPNTFDGYLGCGVYVDQPSTYMYPKTPFQYAVKKYGTKAFERTTLYIYDTLEEAYNKESELINAEYLKADHTYNYLNTNSYKTIYQFNTSGELQKKWEYSLEAYDFYGQSPKKFQYAIDRKYEFLNSYWALEPEIDVIKYCKKSNPPISVYLYSKKGKLLNEFQSEKECAEYIGILDISKAIKNQSLVQNQYYISKKLVDEFIPKARISCKNLIYYVYDKEGNYIGRFKGKEVMKVINLHSWAKIQNILSYNEGWYKDYYISTTEVSKVPQKCYSNGMIIDVYDKFGNYIETLNTIKEVREKYNIPSNKLKNIQMGDRYYKDYIFKYHTNK